VVRSEDEDDSQASGEEEGGGISSGAIIARQEAPLPNDGLVTEVGYVLNWIFSLLIHLPCQPPVANGLGVSSS